MADNKVIKINIKRQENPESSPYWEEFEVGYREYERNQCTDGNSEKPCECQR